MKPELYIPESFIMLNEMRRTIIVEVVFGMPAKDCLYHGICRIDQVNEVARSRSNAEMASSPGPNRSYSRAEVSVSATGGLVFRFHKQDMLRGKASRHFGSGYFIVLEQFRIPAWMSEALDIQNYYIDRGIYKVIDDDNWYEVVF